MKVNLEIACTSKAKLKDRRNEKRSEEEENGFFFLWNWPVIEWYGINVDSWKGI